MLQPHQQRVIDEKADLDDKLSRLTPFLDTPTFNDLPPRERQLLQQQCVVMCLYADVLRQRIALF